MGMAIAEKAMASSSTSRVTSSTTTPQYAFIFDGCLMEGISHETCSWPGTLGLKPIAFWDDNGISIDGHVEGWFTDDTPKRFRALRLASSRPLTVTNRKPSTAIQKPPRPRPASRP